MNSEAGYLMILGFIETLPAHDKEQVKKLHEDFMAIMTEHPMHGPLALALTGARLTAESEKEASK